MRSIAATLSAIATLALAGCAQSPVPADQPTRFETATLTFHSDPIVSDGVAEQAAALNVSAQRLVRASTVNGAMIGAAVGCGVGLLTGGGAVKCASKAAVGTVGGAVAGNLSGKRDVKRRVELASPNALVRNMRAAKTHLTALKNDLPGVLAAQDAELNRLTLAYANNQISRKTHDDGVRTIRDERAALADALSLSAAAALKASANLKTAAARGHTGLDWHIAATSQLARETTSARSTISLL